MLGVEELTDYPPLALNALDLKSCRFIATLQKLVNRHFDYWLNLINGRNMLILNN